MASNLSKLQTSMFQDTGVRSASDFVHNAVRQAILNHQYPGGTRLVEAKISKELGVSITPVREAFAKLVNQGLLTTFPYKGTYVTVISQEYVNNVYDLRRHLEEMAAENGFANLTEQDIQYYEKLCANSDIAYDRNDLYESIRCDVMFHEYMFHLNGNDLLMEMWDIIKYRIENIQSYTKPVMNARMSVRHRPMLDALRARDYDSYISALTDHLNSNLSNSKFPLGKDIRYS